MKDILDIGIKEGQSKLDIRNRIVAFESEMRKLPGAMIGDVCPLKHTFAHKIYVREIFMPKGMLIVSKIHKYSHPYFVLKGDVAVLTDKGVIRIKAPFYDITPAGTKRVLYIHEDTTWVTIHVTEETDLKKVEEEIIAKNFDDVLPDKEDILKLRED